MELWPRSKPPLPDTRNWACHGSLGWTLQQAMDEIMNSAPFVENAPRPQDPGSRPNEGEQGSAGSVRQLKLKTDGSESEASSESMEEERKPEIPEPASTPAVASTPGLQVTPEMRDAVLEALASANKRKNQGPHALLKGRIKYYQRQGSRWRIEVDDAQIRRSHPLPRIRRKKDEERISLWEASGQGRRSKGSGKTKWSFELLAYNDIE